PRSARPAPLLPLLHSSSRFRARPRAASRQRSTNRIHRRTGMRALALIVISICTALAPTVAAAQDAAELKKQIEELQKQLEAVTDRLRKLEAQPPPTAPAAQAPPPAAASPSAGDRAPPRQPVPAYPT